MGIMDEKDSRFLKGAFILALSGLLVKVIGALYRIPLYAILGSEGMGLFQMAYPIYAILLTVSSAGLNVAISKVVAERRALGQWGAARAAFGISMFLMVSIGLVGSITLYAMSGWISVHMAKDPRARLSIAAISPALLMAGILSSLRGWFQGIEEMGVPAVSQVIEAIGRLLTMFFLAQVLLARGIEYAASGATFGAVAGAAVGAIYAAGAYVLHSKKWQRGNGQDREPWDSVVRQVLSIAVPVSLASAVFGITEVIDLGLVPGRLQAAGFVPEEATRLYGRLTGAAFPLLNIPTIFTGALQVALVPSISAAWVIRDKAAVSRRVRKALVITSALAVPAALGLHVLADPIPMLLYKDPGVGPILRTLTPGVFFLALQQVTSAILQGTGQVKLPLYNLFWAALAKSVLIFLLVPSMGILGAGVATSVYFMVAALMNLLGVLRQLGPVVDTWGFFKIALSGAVMAVIVAISYGWMAPASWKVGAVAAIGIGVLVYGALSLVLGVVTLEDLESLPVFGSLAAKLVRKKGSRK